MEAQGSYEVALSARKADGVELQSQPYLNFANVRKWLKALLRGSLISRRRQQQPLLIMCELNDWTQVWGGHRYGASAGSRPCSGVGSNDKQVQKRPCSPPKNSHYRREAENEHVNKENNFLARGAHAGGKTPRKVVLITMEAAQESEPWTADPQWGLPPSRPPQLRSPHCTLRQLEAVKASEESDDRTQLQKRHSDCFLGWPWLTVEFFLPQLTLWYNFLKASPLSTCLHL